MAFQATLQKLYARRRFGIKPGVERVATLLERLGNPQQNFRTIHIVGTNGKGSTSAFLSSIFSASGHSTALFTSPHLVSFCERFRINGTDASEYDVEKVVEQAIEAAEEESTFFEIITAAAALLFAEKNVGIAVIEAGMGGRSDATAAFKGDITLLTPISLDHCDYLGNTITAITSEKFGIASSGGTVITAAQTPEAISEIRALASQCDVKLYEAISLVSADYSVTKGISYSGLHCSIDSVRPGVPGRYQIQNATLAMLAAEILAESDLAITSDTIRDGIEGARWGGRMELLNAADQRILIDGAHNEAGMAALLDALGDYHFSKLYLIIGAMDDKQFGSSLERLLMLAESCFCVTVNIDRALDSVSLATRLMPYNSNAVSCGSLESGIKAARAVAEVEDMILVCGSLFLVGEVKALFGNSDFIGIRG